jgi:hypothetical protein
MNDTPAEVEAYVRERYRAMTPTERLVIATGMFETARTLAAAGIRAAQPDISAIDLKVALFERFYGRDFTDTERATIIHRIRADAHRDASQ